MGKRMKGRNRKKEKRIWITRCTVLKETEGERNGRDEEIFKVHLESKEERGAKERQVREGTGKQRTKIVKKKKKRWK